MLAEKVFDTFRWCPVPEIARLGRTLRAWRSRVLAYLDINGMSNGGKQAINMLIEKARRLAHGYGNIDDYRLPSADRPGGAEMTRPR